MKKFIIGILFFILAWGQSYGQPTENGDSIRISLLTCAPGEELYSLFGHTAILVEDMTHNSHIVFNYGIFSFNTPNFALRFALGETDYVLGAEDIVSFMTEYTFDNREVKQQVLNLTHSEKLKLISLLSENYLPQNRTYRYNFFYDNCATRPRDKIEECLQGEVVYPNLTKGNKVTYRDVVYTFSEGHPWARFGFNLCLGSQADEPITLRQMMFAPYYLRDAFAGADITYEGTHRPLVSSTNVLIKAEPEEEQQGWQPTPIQCAMALLLVVLIVSIRNVRRQKEGWIVPLLLFTTAGLAGCLLTFLSLFSSHPAMNVNYQLALFHPLHLLCIPYIIYCLAKKKRCGYHLFNIAVLTLFIAIFPVLPQRFDPTIIPLALCLWVLSASHILIYYKKKA